MVLLSVLIAVPFNYSAAHDVRRLQHCRQCVISVANVGLGACVIVAAYEMST